MKIRIFDRLTCCTAGDEPTRLQMCKNRTEYHTNGGRDIEIALEVAMIIRRRRSGQCGRFKKI